jgi:ERCC4-related helicase
MAAIIPNCNKIFNVTRGVSALVGHGTTSGTDPGMKVSHQKGVLDNIREHKYNIVVATSVAEEGIDIPECELVITLNQSSFSLVLLQTTINLLLDFLARPFPGRSKDS